MTFELLVETIPDQTGEAVMRCIEGTVRIGDTITKACSIEAATTETMLAVGSIELYDGIFVDELECAHVGRVRLRGEIPTAVVPGWRLRGQNGP